MYSRYSVLSLLSLLVFGLRSAFLAEIIDQHRMIGFDSSRPSPYRQPAEERGKRAWGEFLWGNPFFVARSTRTYAKHDATAPAGARPGIGDRSGEIFQRRPNIKHSKLKMVKDDEHEGSAAV